LVSPVREHLRDVAISALLVGSYGIDGTLLHDVFRSSGWKLFEAADPRHALQFLRQHSVNVVLSGADHSSWTWRDVLEGLRTLPKAPALIVTSRVADDYLWAEVLNVGGHDVLAQPFNATEVERVVAAAGTRCEPKPARAVARAASSAYA
jgi:DNA-binding response OmpR family regulator